MRKKLSTGLKGFDDLLQGLRHGDNIVWQIESMDDYVPFVKPFCDYARHNGFKPVYFRFARHAPLLQADSGAQIFELDAQEGFYSFVHQFHQIIQKIGPDGVFIFDCLSDLAVDWYSDRMLGNFFLLVSPYIRMTGAIAYFALFRNRHSFHAMTPILDSAPVFLDVYQNKDKIYVHPIKMQGRFWPTMNMPHLWQGDQFIPVTDSVTITEILSAAPWSRLDSASYRLGPWSTIFAFAEEIETALSHGRKVQKQAAELLKKLVRMVISRKERLIELALQYLTLTDILNIRKRMIGTGLIGGKSAGMLLSRAILQRRDQYLASLLEPHDSFYIGSDVFYTFLVSNEIWWLYQQQRNTDDFLRDAEKARQMMLEGLFPEYIVKQFADMLDYFGQSPIIVRSSSLLEDDFGNAFAGKYESIFCANQGSRQQRLQSFLSAIRRVYASTMSDKALNYRRQRGLLDNDEQMAILVQRVSGAPYGKYFFPQAAGVGFSFNPYVWSEYIQADAGMLRLVFGLGTRAVDHIDDDYARIVALNAPERQLVSNISEARRFSQKQVDVLDLEQNILISKKLDDITSQASNIPIEIFASKATFATGSAGHFDWVLTFDKLLSETNFADDMRKVLAILQKAYDYPVDIEFTLNFFGDGAYKINLVQCRPLQLNGSRSDGPMIPENHPQVSKQDIIFDVSGPVIGPSRQVIIDRLVYISPKGYGQLSISQRHSIARLIGKIARTQQSTPAKTTMLIGPGRWGTTTPSLGVPVSFSEINNVSVLCEIASMGSGVYPDISLGTHFFSDLIEMDILYLGIVPTRNNVFVNEDFLENSQNKLSEILPDHAQWANIVHVIDPADLSKKLILYANVLQQKFISYLSLPA